jgi:hypothetical protein
VKALVGARESASSPYAAMVRLAKDAHESATFPKSLSNYANGQALSKLLRTGDAELMSALDEFSGKADHASLAADRQLASDALIALTILGAWRSEALDAASVVLRGVALLGVAPDSTEETSDATDGGGEAPKSPSEKAVEVRRRLLSTAARLPGAVFPLPSPYDDYKLAREASESERAAAAKAAAEKQASAGRGALESLREIEEARSKLARAFETSHVREYEMKVLPDEPGAPSASPAASGRGVIGLLARVSTPTMARVPTVRIEPAILSASRLALDASTVKTLTDAGIAPEAFTAPRVRAALDRSESRVRTVLLRSYPQLQDFRKVSTDWKGFKIVSPKEIWTPATGVAPPAGPSGPDAEPEPPNLSTTHGAIEKLAIADLMIVHQVLARYEMGEIAHIENVLAGEEREYRTVRTSTVEQSLLTEREKTTEEERDQQTTDRFELKRESEKTIEEDSSLKAGLALSARYGTMLEVNTNVSGSLDEHKQESVKQAATFSKDVTSRGTSKVTERIRTLQSQRTVEKFVDANRHKFAADKSKDIIGIYQWVDKVYHAQVLNYGQRAMYNIVVPEPAAFWLDAFKGRDAAIAIKPEPFELLPELISSRPGDFLVDSSGVPIDLQGNALPAGVTPIPSDYMFYAARYQATGVKPAPALQCIVSKTASSKVQDAGTDSKGSSDTKEFAIPIPAGYEAISVFVTGSWKATTKENWDNGQHMLVVLVGGTAIGMKNPDNGWVQPEATLLLQPTNAAALGTTTELGVAINTWNIADYALTINVVCKATQEAIYQWQLDTHGAIMQGYLKQQADYDQKRTEAAQEALSSRAFGTNPSVNRKIINDEIKKSVISIISQQTFGWIGAIKSGVPEVSHLYPQPDFDKIDKRASYIQFMEQAFEWEHVTYFFYPYFWGRKSGWYDKANLDDGDEQFLDFLRAGAARVVLPVRPGFEEAIAHFIDTKYLWNENNNNAMSPDLMAIVDEIRASSDALGKPPTAVGTPWEVRVPTTLIKLRESSAAGGGGTTAPAAMSTLPRWLDPASNNPTDAWLPAKYDAQNDKWVVDSSPQ